MRRATNLSEDLVDEIEEGLVDQLDKLNQHKTNPRARKKLNVQGLAVRRSACIKKLAKN